MTETQLTETVGPSISRRTLLRSTAAATGAATVGVGSDHLGFSPVGDAEAIPPLVIGLGAAAATGWAVREYEVVGSDDPPEGLTADALRNQIYQSARTRQSTNRSTIVDNRNIVDGIEHSAYADGKIAAIEQINEEEQQEDVEQAAIDAVDEYATTVISNLIEIWNESVRELSMFVESLEDHPDLSRSDVIKGTPAFESEMFMVVDDDDDLNQLGPDDIEYELPDGDLMDLETIREELDPNSTTDPIMEYNLANDGSHSVDDDEILVRVEDDDHVDYLPWESWNGILTDIEDAFDAVRDGLIMWVDGVYDDVQAGDLDPEELLTPRELAEMTADEEDFNQAVADLMALNVSVDLEREAEIYLSHVDATLHGSIARTGEGELTTGTYDPDAEDESFYLTYDVSLGSGEWDAYESGIDGGEVTFTSEPFEESEFHIETAAGETATAVLDDFDYDADADEWVADLSGQLEDQITEVESVSYYATTEETQYETILLSEEFEIITFADSDGEEHDSADFTRSEPQDDENYIDQEEWDEMQQRHEELIEDYEDAQSGGGGLPFDSDDWSIGPIPGGGVIGGIAVLVLIVLGALNPTN